MNWIDFSGMKTPETLPENWDFSSRKEAMNDKETAACGDTLLLTFCSPEIEKDGLYAVRDHVNLSGNNPLRGHNNDELGVRFPDMSHPYAVPEPLKKNAILIRAGQNDEHPFDAVDAPEIVEQTILAKHQLKTVYALIYGKETEAKKIIKIFQGE